MESCRADLDPADLERETMGGAEMILFVEDEAQQLKYMQRLLEGEGYRVLGARDGIEAVALHRRHSDEIALVILDLRLPKLSGWDAFQEMKKEHPRLKALVASAYATPQVKSAVENGELLGLFVKPYSVDLFLSRISDLIRKPA
jgi:two-component system cell cycle sensor histidine kinase/response regulator CckA